MSSVQRLREFIRERLTAAAEEIFTEVETTIVRYEEDIRLLETCWKPQIKLTRIDQPKQHVSNKDEVLTDPELWNQQRSSSVDQEEPEPPEVRENQEEPEPPEVRENQEEPEPPEIRREPEPPEIRRNPEEPEPPEVRENQEEPEPPEIRREPEPPEIRRNPEEPEPPEVRENQEEPEPPEIRRNPEEPEPPEIRREPEPHCIRGKQQELNHLLIKDQEEPEFGKNVVQTRLLGICRNPRIQLTRTDFPKQHVCGEEEVLSGQQVWNQEEPEPQQVEDELPGAEYFQFEEDHENQEGPLMNEDQEDLRPEPPHRETRHEELELQTVEIRSSRPLLSDSDTFMKPLSDEECELEPEPEQIHYQNPPEAQNSLDFQADPHQSKEEPEHLQQPEEELGFSHKTQQKKRKCDKTIGKREKVHFCSTCGKRYYYLKSLLTHMRTHAPKLHPCETCGNQFSSEEALNSHMLEHTLDKLHPCEICGERFYRQAALLKHMRDHFDQTSYPCESCGKRFISYSGLQSHMKVHTAEKLYSCDVCGKTFTLACQLNHHVKSKSCGEEGPTKQ